MPCHHICLCGTSKIFFSWTRRRAEYHFIKKKEKCTRKREKTPSTQHTRLICRTQPNTRHDAWKGKRQPPEHGVTRLGWMSNSWSPTAPAEHHRALSFADLPQLAGPLCDQYNNNHPNWFWTTVGWELWNRPQVPVLPNHFICLTFGRLFDENYEITIIIFRWMTWKYHTQLVV